jgi:hypothetical protein
LFAAFVRDPALNTLRLGGRQQALALAGVTPPMVQQCLFTRRGMVAQPLMTV